MIIWSGWGMLSALITGAALVGSVLLDPALARWGIPTPTGVVLVWLVAAFANWRLGKGLNGRPGRELVDPRTGSASSCAPATRCSGFRCSTTRC